MPKHMRLGVVLPGFWGLLSPSAYFLTLWLYRNFPLPTKLWIKTNLWELYHWGFYISNFPRGEHFPSTDSVRLTLLIISPLLICWLVLCIIPCSFRWVLEGYQNDD